MNDQEDSLFAGSLDALSPEMREALSYPIEAAVCIGSADPHRSIEEIVDIAVSRCQGLVLDDGPSGTDIVKILNGMTVLASNLHLENARYLHIRGEDGVCVK